MSQAVEFVSKWTFVTLNLLPPAEAAGERAATTAIPTTPTHTAENDIDIVRSIRSSGPRTPGKRWPPFHGTAMAENRGHDTPSPPPDRREIDTLSPNCR